MLLASWVDLVLKILHIRNMMCNGLTSCSLCSQDRIDFTETLTRILSDDLLARISVNIPHVTFIMFASWLAFVVMIVHIYKYDFPEILLG